jgi:hypothetical protein
MQQVIVDRIQRIMFLGDVAVKTDQLFPFYNRQSCIQRIKLSDLNVGVIQMLLIRFVERDATALRYWGRWSHAGSLRGNRLHL